jgi:hypothetical protein
VPRRALIVARPSSAQWSRASGWRWPSTCARCRVSSSGCLRLHLGTWSAHRDSERVDQQGVQGHLPLLGEGANAAAQGTGDATDDLDACALQRVSSSRQVRAARAPNLRLIGFDSRGPPTARRRAWAAEAMGSTGVFGTTHTSRGSLRKSRRLWGRRRVRAGRAAGPPPREGVEAVPEPTHVGPRPNRCHASCHRRVQRRGSYRACSGRIGARRINNLGGKFGRSVIASGSGTGQNARIQARIRRY